MQTFIIFALYRSLQAIAFPFLLLYVLRRVARDPRYKWCLGERFGLLPPQFQRTARDSVWLHAVSVGEVLSSIEFIRRLRAELPGAPVFVSCTTLAGRAAAESKLAHLTDGIFFAPIDYVFAIRRVIRRIRPALLVVLETEIWPNLYSEVKRAGCALVVVNGRISDKALPAYLKWAWLFRWVLALPDFILVQSLEQRDRYLRAGAPPESTRSIGNLKYDFDPFSATLAGPLMDWIEAGSGPLWIAASTVAPEFDGDVDEDDAVLAAVSKLGSIRLLIAPRKPERFAVVADKMTAAGMRFARRTTLPASGDAAILLLDSVGELSAVFRFADVVFVGGTLARRGGHNILEPALAERAIVAGSHLENFAEIQKRFRDGKGFVEIVSAADLEGAVRSLLDNPAAARILGLRAKELADSERGATERAVRTTVAARWLALPRVIPCEPLLPLLRILTGLWAIGGAVKRFCTPTGRLAAPVISVGGIAMGGSGKTPVVRHLVRGLHRCGLQSTVLTRGYGRKLEESVTVIAAGSIAPVRLTGDEAQMLLRDGIAHLGIGRDRLAVGLAVSQRMTTDVFVLDDGFQHARVHRDLDIVVLDGLDPFAGGEVFPIGRMREPIGALRRAHLIVISRSESRQFDGVVQAIREANATAPIFLCSTVPLEQDALVLRGRRVFAFCGIGNPEAFRQTLLTLPCEIAGFRTFPDHHEYSAEDLKRIREEAQQAGAEEITTTEKDSVKLPDDFPARCLRTEIRVDDFKL